MSQPTKSARPLASVAGLLGALGGWALSRYSGASFWIPGLVMLLLVMLFAKTPLRPRWFTGAIAVTGGHLAWFILGSAVTGNWVAAGLDIIVLFIGIIWLWLLPGLASALFLGVVQAVSLAINGIALAAASFGDDNHRALTVHCVFRLLALIYLVQGYMQMRRARAAGPPPPLPAS